jgi:hypothetical protein
MLSVAAFELSALLSVLLSVVQAESSPMVKSRIRLKAIPFFIFISPFLNF